MPRPMTPFQEAEPHDAEGTQPVASQPLKRQPVSIRDLARQRPAGPAGGGVEAEVGGEQTISLSPIAASIQEAVARGETPPPGLRRLAVSPPPGAAPAQAPAPAPGLRRPPPVPGEEAADAFDDEPPTNPIAAQQQALLQLEPLSKGRFAKVEPTIEDGQDLDVPTFLRRRRK